MGLPSTEEMLANLGRLSADEQLAYLYQLRGTSYAAWQYEEIRNAPMTALDHLDPVVRAELRLPPFDTVLIDEETAMQLVDNFDTTFALTDRIRRLYTYEEYENGIPIDRFMVELNFILLRMRQDSIDGHVNSSEYASSMGIIDDVPNRLAAEFGENAENTPYQVFLRPDEIVSYLASLQPNEQQLFIDNIPLDIRDFFLDTLAESESPQLVYVDPALREALGLRSNEDVWEHMPGQLSQLGKRRLINEAKAMIDSWHHAGGKEALDRLRELIDTLPEEFMGQTLQVKSMYQEVYRLAENYKHRLVDLLQAIQTEFQDYELDSGPFTMPTVIDDMQGIRASFENLYEALGIVEDEFLNNTGPLAPVLELLSSVLFEPADWVLTGRDLFQDYQDDGRIGAANIAAAGLTLLPIIPNLNRIGDIVRMTDTYFYGWRHGDNVAGAVNRVDGGVDITSTNISIHSRSMAQSGDTSTWPLGEPILEYDNLTSIQQELINSFEDIVDDPNVMVRGLNIAPGEVTVRDIEVLSQWYVREFAVAQNITTGDLRIVSSPTYMGDRVSITIGEEFVLHTHPGFDWSVLQDSTLTLDLRNATENVELVTNLNENRLQRVWFRQNEILSSGAPHFPGGGINEEDYIVGFSKHIEE